MFSSVSLTNCKAYLLESTKVGNHCERLGSLLQQWSRIFLETLRNIEVLLPDGNLLNDNVFWMDFDDLAERFQNLHVSPRLPDDVRAAPGSERRSSHLLFVVCRIEFPSSSMTREKIS